MRTVTCLPLLAVLFLGSAMHAQQIHASPSPAQAKAQSSNNLQIDEVLKRYEGAYDHRSIDELLTIWPSLRDSKDFKKIKYQFDRADILSMKIDLKIENQQPASQESTVLQCTRTQDYVQLETSNQYLGGDLNVNRMPAQNSGPSNDSSKKAIHKTGNIWLTLHKNRDSWLIAFVSEKKPH